MKRLILPGAAGIIAMTATMGFTDGRCDIEEKSFARGKVTLVNNAENIAIADAISSNQPDIKPEHHVYVVEICCNKKLSKVRVDAVTGRVLV